MYPSIAELKNILISESYITEENSHEAESSSTDSASYIKYLIHHEYLSETLLGQAIAENYKLPYYDLSMQTPSVDLIKEVPENLAKSSRVILIKKSLDSLIFTTDHPPDVKVGTLGRLFPNKQLLFAYSLPQHIEDCFKFFDKPLEIRFSSIIESGEKVALGIVTEIVKEANNYKASDIHFEPQLDGVRVRFRIDGTLKDAGNIPPEQYEFIINKIKVDSGMRIDEHYDAQDGSLQLDDGNGKVNLRISLTPTINGEKIAIRVLSTYIQDFTLEDIGFNEVQLESIREFSHKPFGMILTAGPTGSGKTTTLYSILRMLNQSNVNITTIEDPVELRIPGTNQIQVKEQSGMTFAQGLRSIVRQDPDIILVGEIRDSETAEISVNAALTGHLVLSSFHSNDAATAIPRLIDMGVEPFLLSSTLQVIVAQRLVRRLCMTCRYSAPIETVLAEHVNKKLINKYFPAGSNTYASKGCVSCNDTGYKGRTAIYEMIIMSPTMQELVMTSPTAQAIWKLALKEGTIPMIEDGFNKVRQGVTSIEEVLRVVEAPKLKD